MNLTIGDLRKYLEKHNPPDDAIVLVERIEDMYFEKHDWKTVKKIDVWEIHEYIKSFCVCQYKDDNNLYINCHY